MKPRHIVIGLVAAVLCGVVGMLISHGTFYLFRGTSVFKFVSDELAYSGRRHDLLFMTVTLMIVPVAIAVTGGALAARWMRAKRNP